MSAYPLHYDNDLDDNERIKCLLESGIRTFVCLTEQEPTYQECMEQIYLNRKMISNIPLKFIWYPIIDKHVPEYNSVDQFTNELIERYNGGENILLHCMSGNGRTGTIAACFIGRLLSCSGEDALKRVGMSHDCRDQPKGCAPETDDQFELVYRICDNNREA
jgi:protein tyrosine phosphatase